MSVERPRNGNDTDGLKLPSTFLRFRGGTTDVSPEKVVLFCVVALNIPSGGVEVACVDGDAATSSLPLEVRINK